MVYSSKEIALAAAVPDNLQFMQDIRRHNLPIHAKKFNGANRYDLTSFAVAMIVGELREYGISLASCGRLLSRIDLDDLSHKTEQLQLEEINELIVLIPQRDDYDEEFPTSVVSWDDVRYFGRDEYHTDEYSKSTKEKVSNKFFFFIHKLKLNVNQYSLF